MVYYLIGGIVALEAIAYWLYLWFFAGEHYPSQQTVAISAVPELENDKYAAIFLEVEEILSSSEEVA